MSSENEPLKAKRVVVLGASRGVGREIVQRASAEGAQVLAVARQGDGLAALAKSTPGIETLALDAATEAAPANVFRKGRAQPPGDLWRRYAAGPADARAHLGRIRA